MKFIEKPWGSELIIESNDRYTVKKLTMNSGCQCSLQYHEFKHETIYHLKGEMKFIIGKNKDYFISQFKNKINFKYLKNLKKAISIIKKDIKGDLKEKVILFSPAAASFDQYKNFEHRGNYFNKLIKKIDIYE